MEITEFSCGHFVFETPVTQPCAFRRYLELRAGTSERDNETSKLASCHFHRFSVTGPMPSEC